MFRRLTILLNLVLTFIKKISLWHLLFAVGVTTLSSCQSNDIPLKGVEGVIDVADVHGRFSADGGEIASLQGDWAFFYKQLVQDSMPSHTAFRDPLYLPLGLWNNQGFDSSLQYIAHGFGTYHLTIKNLPDRNYAISSEFILTAHRVWCNDQLVKSVGVPTDNAQTTIPGNSTVPVVLSPKNGTIDLFVEVSNFHHRKGGFVQKVYFGEASTILQKRDKKVFTELMAASVIIAISLYSLLMFLVNRNKVNYLYFGLYCLCGTIRQFSIGTSPINTIFPDLPFFFLQSMRYIGFIMGFFFGVLFFMYELNIKSKHILFEGFKYLTAGISILIITTPFWFSGFFVTVFQFLSFIGIFYAFYKMATKMKTQPLEMGLLSGGLFIFTLFYIWDVLVANRIIEGEFVQQYAFLSFALSQSIYLSFTYKNMVIKLENTKSDIEQIGMISKSHMVHYDHLKNNLSDLRTQTTDKETKQMINKIIRKISIENDEEYQLALDNIDTVNTEFYNRLRSKYPDLTKGELELCGWFRAQLTSKQIATLRNIDPASVKRARNRLRKKLQLKEGEDTVEFIKTV